MKHGVEVGYVRGQGFTWEWFVTFREEELRYGHFFCCGFFGVGLVKAVWQLSWE